MKFILPMLIVFSVLAGCSSSTKLTKIPNKKVDKVSLDTVFVVNTIPGSHYRRLVFGWKSDTTNFDSIPIHVLGKLDRMFGEKGVTTLPCDGEINDTVISYLNNYFGLLGQTKDINSILLPDTVMSYLDACPGRFFVLTSSAGGVLSPFYRFRKNVKWVLLEIVTLRRLRYRITKGWSRFYLAIVDKEKSRAVYYGYSKRFLIPQKEITTNKQIQLILHDFFKKQFIRGSDRNQSTQDLSRL